MEVWPYRTKLRCSTILNAAASSVVTSDRSYLDHGKAIWAALCRSNTKIRSSHCSLAQAHCGEDRLLAHVNIPDEETWYPPTTPLALKLSPGLGRRPALVID